MQKIIKPTGFTLMGILAIAVITYAYMNLVSSSLSRSELFEKDNCPNYLIRI